MNQENGKKQQIHSQITKQEDSIQGSQPQSQLYAEFKSLLEESNQQFSGQTMKATQVFTLYELNTKEIQKLFLVTLELIDSLDFFITKKIDQRVWQVIKKQCEFMAQIQLVGTDYSKQYDDFFQRNIQFYKNIIRTINQKYPHIQKSSIELKNAQRRCLANHYCYLGELYESLEKQMRKLQISNQNNLNMAAGFYQKALSIFPFDGKFHFLFATLMMVYEDLFAAAYSLFKALLSQIPWNCKENLQNLFEMNRKLYNTWAQYFKPSPEVSKDEYFKAFMIYFLRLQSIIFTRIGFDELEKFQKMFSFLQNYLQILNTNVVGEIKRHKMQLLNVVTMSIFGLHYSIFGQEQKQSVNKQFLEENDMVRETIKYAYGVFICILDFVHSQLKLGTVKNLDEVENEQFMQFSDLLIPIIYYFYEQPIICEYLLDKCPPLNYRLCQILWHAKTILYKMESIDAQENEELKGDNKLCSLQQLLQQNFSKYILHFEKDLIGFTTYNRVFATLKQELLIPDKITVEDKMILFYVCEQLIQNLKGIKMNQMDEIDGELRNDQLQIPSPTKQEKEKPLVVIDGMNVAIRYGQECKGDNRFFTQGLRIALDYWISKGHKVLILLPDFCFSVDEIQKKRAQNKNLFKLPDDVPMLRDFKLKGFATGIPNWNYDDSYMIQYARSKNGFILTNDRYNDHIKSLDSNIVEREKLKEWIRNNCINYTFIHNELVPNPDFMKAKNLD